MAVVFTLALRAGFAIVGLFALQDGSRIPLHGNFEELVLPQSDVGTRLLSMWQRWDALWYQHIAEQGYRSGDGSTAFFPLFPVLMRAAGTVVGSDLLGGLIVSTVAFAVAMWLLFVLTSRETGRADVGYVAVLLIAFFPTSFFLLAPFTESTFLALTLGAFLLSRSGRHAMAGALGLAASLTRAQGALLVLPLTYEYARQRGLLPRAGGTSRLGLDVSAVGPLLPLVGPIVFSQYISAAVGEHRSAFEVLAIWGYEVVPPWDALARSFDFILHPANGASPDVEFLNLVSLLGFGALGVLAWRRLPRMYAIYALASVGLLITRQMWFSPLMSVSRYALVIFPSFIVLALLLNGRRVAIAATLAVSALVLFAAFNYWVRWGFVG